MESLIGSNVNIQELYNVEETIHFTNSTKFKSELNTISEKVRERDSLSDHTILITGFPDNNLLNYDQDGSAYPLRKAKKLFLTDLKVLIITMAGGPHERACRLLCVHLDRKLCAMGCEEELLAAGREQQELPGVKKDPDESWMPRSKDYITLAVEIGVSESASALANDAKIWLEHPESHVKQVLTIGVSKAREEITFRLWKVAPQERETRSTHPPRASMDHSVLVTLENGEPVAHGTITISFEEALERKPHRGTAEKDFVFSPRELGAVSRLIFERLGCIPRP
jgi:hypothetical protein